MDFMCKVTTKTSEVDGRCSPRASHTPSHAMPDLGGGGYF